MTCTKNKHEGEALTNAMLSLIQNIFKKFCEQEVEDVHISNKSLNYQFFLRKMLGTRYGPVQTREIFIITSSWYWLQYPFRYSSW